MPPKASTSKRKTDSEDDFTALRSWMESKHPGFSCRLVSKEIPGAGRGLFTEEAIPAGETILEIPSSALLNPLTLAAGNSGIPDNVFPLSISASSSAHPAKRAKTTRAFLDASASRRLNTTQLLTLYLALNRDAKPSAPWGEYLATLPKSFAPWQPLTWYYNDEYEGWWHRLPNFMPISAKRKLEDVKRRYEEDAEVLRAVMNENQSFKSQNPISDDTLLWAWLNVNTRTVSIPLDLPGPSSLHNHTLVPILDMLNHSAKPDEIIPTPIQYPSSSSAATGPAPGSSRRGGPGGAQPHLIPGKIGFRLIAPERGLEAGEQVRFTYGAHSSEMLFTEYGFVPEGKRGDWLGQPNGEVDVNDLVEELFPIKSEKVKSALEGLGCWKQNFIYTHPKPAHASHGLIMTLRLYHLNKLKTKRNSEIFEDIRLGLETYADGEGVERDTRKSLIDLCAQVWDRSGRAQSDIGHNMVIKFNDGEVKFLQDGEDAALASDAVGALWYERTAIARKLKTGIAAGQRIWD